ncbi:hypothetical protein PLICRDRAFT_55359 [Plicaturopsis crispa FD-325 SS-3]|nr:hypothetical protein PLICRDRAFT_55359 [Plicaturopsis crispa FD-325 SS-3]
MESANPNPIPFNLDEVSAFSGADVVDAARQHVDNEIAALERSIRAFKTRRNEFALISRLPPEILSEVFHCYQAIMQISELDTSWMTAMYVCRHWRDIALDCPRLWSYIVPRTTKWTKKLLARSKDAPLTIVSTIPNPARSFEHSLKLALSQVSRASAVHLTTTTRCMESIFDDFATPAPILESLTLEVSDPWQLTGPDPNAYTIPETFCSGINPMLRYFSLRSCGIPWGSSFLNNIQVLKMSAIPVAFRPSMSDILGILGRASSSLSVFEIRDSVDSSGESFGAPGIVVNLPHLTSIHISSCTARECGTILAHLKLPASAAIELECTLSDDITTDLANILPTVAASSATGCSLQSLDVRLALPEPCMIDIRGWHASDVDLTAPHIESAPHISVRLMATTLASHALYGAELAIAICQSLLLTQVRNIAVTNMGDMSEAAWVETFRRCALVNKLTVSDGSALGLIKALDQDGTDSSTAHVFLPGLKDLQLVSVNFWGDDPDGSGVHILCKCLTGRAQQNVKLERLSIQACPWFTNEDVTTLRTIEAVNNVEWDGYINYRMDDDDFDDHHYNHFDYDGDDYPGHWSEADFYDLPTSIPF